MVGRAKCWGAWIVLAVSLPLACGGKDKPAENATGAQGSVALGAMPSGSAPPSGSATSPPPAASSGPPLAPTFTTDPNQLAALFAAAAAAGAAMLQNPGLAGDPVEAGLKASAAKNAVGMSPEGQVAKGTLKEGEHLDFLVPLQAGKCYTIVGFSPTGAIADLDINLLAPPYTILAGQDGTTNNTPVIGKTPNPMCPVIPIPLSYKVDVVAKKGAGPMGVQVYSKTK